MGEPSVPQGGTTLSIADMEMLFDAVRDRQKNFPDEHAAMSFYIVICGIGDRFRKVQCIEQEWTGLKKDIPPGEGIPTCPNGHPLMEGPGLRIGWLETE